MSRRGPTGRRVAAIVLRRAKLLVGDHQALLPMYLRLTPEGQSRRLHTGTHLVVEGFPRSGTTNAATSLRRANGADLDVVNHVHNTAILRSAVARGVPTLVLVREPVACLASYLVWDPLVGVRTVVWEYVHYHRRLLALAPSLTVATFAEFLADPRGVVDRLNRRYGTGFVAPERSAEFEDAVAREIRARHAAIHPRREQSRGVPTPDASRDAELAHWRAELRRMHTAGGRLAEASALYEELERLSRSDR